MIPEAAAPALHAGRAAEVEAVRERHSAARAVPAVGGGLRRRIRASGWPRWPAPRARCRWCWSASRAGGRMSFPTCTLTGGSSDDDLAAIYTGAHALVFPSDDEGFGLPPVEALACGTPVVACDVPARAGGPRRPRHAASRSTISTAWSRPPRRPAARAGTAGVDVGGAAAATWDLRVLPQAAEVAGGAEWSAPRTLRAAASRASHPQRRPGSPPSSVTGPSLTSSTAIIAPNTPRLALQSLTEALVERLGQLGRRRRDEARTVAAPGVAVQRELAHAQHLAARRAARSSVRSASGKTRSARTLSASQSTSRSASPSADAEQHQQPGTDRGHRLARRPTPRRG